MARRISAAIAVALALALSQILCTVEVFAASLSSERSVYGGSIHRLMSLKNRTANHRTPDALVYVPAGFDANQPFHLIIYNHGLMDNVDEALKTWQLDHGMQYAPPNSILVLPEWAYNPEAYSSAAGPFHQPGFFRKMLTEIMSLVPETAGKTIDDINDISIVTYSGGFRATRTQLHKNGLEKKVVSVSMLDSLYEINAMDQWLKENIQLLASGRKLFHNFFYDTARNSAAAYGTLQSILAKSGVDSPKLFKDLDNPETVLPGESIARHGIVWKHTNLSDADYTPHMNVAKVYFPEVMKALKIRHEETQIASSRQLFQ